MCKLLSIIILYVSVISCTQKSFPTDSRKSFIQIRQHIEFFICNKKTDKCTKDEDIEWRLRGSASVIATNSLGSFILTAAHVCYDITQSDEFITDMTRVIVRKKKKQYLKPRMHIKITTFSGQIATADIIVEDEDLDTCILFVEDIYEKPLPRYYGELTIGKTYYNIADPASTFAPDLVPLFNGKYIGLRNRFVTAFTIPVYPGSSGSPVLDSQGRLVGMIHSVVPGFHHISYSANISLLNDFIDENMKNYYDGWHRNLLKLTRPKTN